MSILKSQGRFSWGELHIHGDISFWFLEAGGKGFLVGWLQPNWKILVKMDHFPQVGMNIKKNWNHHLAGIWVNHISG